MVAVEMKTTNYLTNRFCLKVIASMETKYMFLFAFVVIIGCYGGEDNKLFDQSVFFNAFIFWKHYWLLR